MLRRKRRQRDVVRVVVVVVVVVVEVKVRTGKGGREGGGGGGRTEDVGMRERLQINARYSIGSIEQLHYNGKGKSVKVGRLH